MTAIASACRTRLLSSRLALVTPWWPVAQSNRRREISMSYTRSAFPEDLLAGEPSVQRPALRKRGSLTRVLFTFFVGVGAALAWQSYGDAARQIIANSYPQLGW